MWKYVISAIKAKNGKNKRDEKMKEIRELAYQQAMKGAQ